MIRGRCWFRVWFRAQVCGRTRRSRKIGRGRSRVDAEIQVQRAQHRHARHSDTARHPRITCCTAKSRPSAPGPAGPPLPAPRPAERPPPVIQCPSSPRTLLQVCHRNTGEPAQLAAVAARDTLHMQSLWALRSRALHAVGEVTEEAAKPVRSAHRQVSAHTAPYSADTYPAMARYTPLALWQPRSRSAPRISRSASMDHTWRDAGVKEIDFSLPSIKCTVFVPTIHQQ